MKKLDFVCFSINNWERRRARKQQFMLHLSLRGDVGKVLYVEPPLSLFRLVFFPFLKLKTKENRSRWLRALGFKIEPSAESQKLFIYTPLFLIPFSYRIQFIYNLNLYISFLIIKVKLSRFGFHNIVLWFYHPFDYCLLSWFKNRIISCFDWTEDWAKYFVEFSQKRRKQILHLEQKIIKDVDIVFVVSKALLERAKRINNNSHQILHGTIPEIFDSYDGRVPDEMKNIPHPILGYAGTVYIYVDIDLISELTEKLPNCSIVLVGNVLYPPKRLVKITQAKNIFILGGKDYTELPKYMMNFDVCILPYISAYVTSPATKVFDYLAAGKPIVSTAIPEIDRFKDCIKIARTKEEFFEFVKESLMEDSLELQRIRKEMARQNSWSLRVNEIMDIIRCYENTSY